MSPYRQMDMAPILAQMPEARAMGLTAAKVVTTVATGSEMPDRIFQAVSGQMEISTSTALAVPYAPVWDVNCYYRDLGFPVPVPPVSRADIRKAYQRLRGEEDERLTYCFKQLVNREFRAKYDAAPLGHIFDDVYLWRHLEALLVAQAVAKRLRGEEMDPRAEYESLKEKVQRQRDLEGDAFDVQTVLGDNSWPYGYYAWKSRVYDDSRLSAWQQMLVQAFSELGVARQIAVGYVGQTPHQWVVKTHNEHTVCFLNDTAEPTLETARSLATILTLHHPDTPSKSPSGNDPPDSSQETLHMTSALPVDADEDLFQTGGAAAVKAADEDRKNRAASFRKTEFLTQLMPDSGDSVIVRLLLDDQQVLRTKQHSFVPTKAAPADKPAEHKWPETMGAVCRYTKRPDGVTTWYNDCYVCDHMEKKSEKTGKMEKYFASDRIWTLAAVRKEIVGTEEMVAQGKITPDRVGRRVGLTDDIVEIELTDKDGNPTGAKVKKKHIVVVNMALKNFWGQFVAFHQAHGTLLDRDYLITRVGEKRETDYRSVSLDPILRSKRDDAGNVIPGETEIFDLRIPAHAALYEDDVYNLKELRKLAREQASDGFYERFFDKRVTVSYSDREDAKTTGEPGFTAAPEGTAVSEPTAGPTQDRLKAMRDKVLADNETAGATAPAEDAEPAKPAPAPAAQASAPASMMDFSDQD